MKLMLIIFLLMNVVHVVEANVYTDSAGFDFSSTRNVGVLINF